MHCTSPGSVPNNVHGFVVNTSVVLKSVENETIKDELKFMRNDSVSDDLEKQIYDDPCELMDDWASPMHIPRSKSWLCCPDTMSGQEQPEFRRKNFLDYQLVTTEPKLRQSTESIDVNILLLSLLCVINNLCV